MTRSNRQNPDDIHIGDTFGRWTVTGTYVRQGTNNDAVFPCVCSCGTVRNRKFRNLVETSKGRNLSCGCLQKEKTSERRKYGFDPDTVQWRQAKWLREAYGITVEDFDRMLVEQSGLCGICEDPLKNPHVDHCHSSLQVRGLLCKTCNLMLGYARDNTDTLEKAIHYLQR